jgi:hypothetical protein
MMQKITVLLTKLLDQQVMSQDTEEQDK